MNLLQKAISVILTLGMVLAAGCGEAAVKGAAEEETASYKMETKTIDLPVEYSPREFAFDETGEKLLFTYVQNGQEYICNLAVPEETADYQTQMYCEEKNTSGSFLRYEDEVAAFLKKQKDEIKVYPCKEALFYCQDGELLGYSLEKDTSKRICRLSEYDLLEYQIQAIFGTEDSVLLACFDPNQKHAKIELVHLYQEENLFWSGEAEQEMQTVKLFVPSTMGSSLFGEAIAGFNKEQKQYRVELEEMELGGILDMEDYYTKIQVTLLKKDCPDMVFFFDEKDIYRYKDKDVFADLSPWLETSQNYSLEDFQENVLDCYRIGGKLIALPTTYSVDTISGRASQMGEKAGWTVWEFLEWLKTHPEVKSKYGLSKDMVLEMCLKGCLNSFVNYEEKRATFDGQEFQKLLYQIQELTLDEKSYESEWSELLNEKATILSDTGLTDYTSYIQQELTRYDNEMVFKGYPSTDGAPVYLLHTSPLCILEGSDCKEGAYAFYEYYIEYRNKEQSLFSGLKEQMAKNRQAAQKPQAILISGNIVEVQCSVDKVDAVLDSAVASQGRDLQVREIVLEEAQSYFGGDKDLDAVCELIQNRICLWLWEE